MEQPRQTSLSDLPKEFDYIIVGGGTAGPVVARRVADGDPAATVLLLEAGKSNEDLIHSHMSLSYQNLQGTMHDWCYETIAQKGLNGRIVKNTRGKFLGGCSGINGTLIVRGAKADYDRWAEAGCTGWGWDDILPYFKKSETFHPDPDFPTSSFHGDSGFLHTTVHPFAPISVDLLESYRDKGFDYKPDMFVEGEYEGVGHSIRTVYQGVRTTGADFISPAGGLRNLTVVTSTLALRVLTSRTSVMDSPRAFAVEVEDHSATTPTRYGIRARREIVLSAGAYNSPVLLMHSGIGPRAQLESAGLSCIVDLKGVGENLQDHLIVANFYELNKPHLTYDRLIFPPGAAELAVQEWKETRGGVMSRCPFGPFAYKRMDELMKDAPEWRDAQAETGLDDPTGLGPNQPHIEYFNTELYGAAPQFKDFPKLPTDSAFGMVTLLSNPVGRGTVRLATSPTGAPADPRTAPVIDHAYLSSPLDVAVLAEGCRFAHEIVLEGRGTRTHVKGAWPAGSVYPQNMEEWKEHVRKGATTIYHPAGTCKMGPASDEWAVVDERLRVRGVHGLRVADTSIMPTLNNGHTQAPTYMIAEKCADLILQDNDVNKQLSRVGLTASTSMAKTLEPIVQLFTSGKISTATRRAMVPQVLVANSPLH